jgi:hypothetical protein
VSYSVYPLFVDFENIRKLIGSKNQEYLDILLRDHTNELEELEEDLDEDLKAVDAVKNLFNGTFDLKEGYSIYGYVFYYLCLLLGIRAVPKYFTQLNINWLSKYPGLDDFFSGNGFLDSFIPLPRDFPSIVCVHISNIEDKIIEIREYLSKNENKEAQQLYEEYLDWLVTAKTLNRSLITFAD